MQIDRVLYPISTLGPGDRLVIWTVGCSKHCYKCANPELWNSNPDKEIDVYELSSQINKSIDKMTVDGITITGGDPLEQITDLNKFLPLLRKITNDVLIYTGYTIEEAKSIFSNQEWKNLESQASVLIDGIYIDELNDNKCVLRGSSNQNIIFFDETKKDIYSLYMEKGRSVQNVFYNERMISVGIHNKDL